MSTRKSKLKRELRREVARTNALFGADLATTSRTSITSAKALFAPTQTFAAPVAPKPVPVITAVVAPKPVVDVVDPRMPPRPAPVTTTVPAPQPAPQPKIIDRGVYAPVPYSTPAAEKAYIPPREPEAEVTWTPPTDGPLVKTGAAPTPIPAPVPTVKKLGIIARIMAFFGFVKASEAKMSGDGHTMSRVEAAGSLVRRARLGDQNAMAIIDMARQNAERGNVQAKLAVGCIKQYIKANPVGNAVFAGDREMLPLQLSRRLRMLARRDIPISQVDPMLGWELGE